MKPEHWGQIEWLYHAVLERAPDERAAFLDTACKSDQNLRREVESLLAYDEQAQHFMESPPDAMAAEMVVAKQVPALVGRNISHYQILSLLGRGGMGDVYLAQDTILGRKIALKLSPERFTKDSEQARRFEREAYAASATNHPNILTVYEIGRAEGLRFIAAEFVDGVTLRQRMQGERMGIDETLSMAIQMASALAAAHEAGIVHRDIKPENVMVRPDGLVKVLDFGLAKLTEGKGDGETERQRDRGIEGRRDEASVQSSSLHLSVDPSLRPSVSPSLTEPGLVIGTISYMAPEQARGLKVDHRTDIFSLGVTLYEMLAGRRPFEGVTTSDVLVGILMKEPEPLEKHRSDAGPELSHAVMRCLAKDREERYQTASELGAALKAAKEQGERQPLGASPRSPGSGAGGEAQRAFLKSRLVWFATALALLMIAAVAYWKLASKVSSDMPIRSLAVLPLENLSGDPAQEYFADGMTDALIGDLAKIGALRVISRTSSMRYKGTKKSLPQIASELRVDALVEGTAQRSGDRVRIQAQLIHAATERHLWVETYERDLSDVLKLQSEIAHAIAREVQVRITPAEQARLSYTRPINRKTFDDYLHGRLHLSEFTDEHLHKAMDYFQSAINADPTYAPAYAGIAQCYNYFGSVQISALPPTEARRRSEEAAGKALELDSELAEAHMALAYVKKFNWDWAGAEQEYKRAIDLNPNHANAHSFYSRYLMAQNRKDEAIAEASRAQELDPLSLQISVTRGFVLKCARRYDEAIEQFRLVLAIDPNHYSAHWNLGAVYADKGQFDEAIASYEKAAISSGRSPGALGSLGMAYGLAGRKVDANKLMNELLELSRRRYVTPVALVEVYIGLGAKDRAFEWLEKAYQERSNYMAYLKVLPEADSLRSDPRFDDLLRRIGLAQ